MAEVGNLDICLGVTLVYFYNSRCGNLLGKITYLMTIMIIVVRLMSGCFYFFGRNYKISLFPKYPPRILGGFIWRFLLKPPISIVRWCQLISALLP